MRCSLKTDWWYSVLMVPWEGLEPSIPYGNAILSRARIPFRHHGISLFYLTKAILRSLISAYSDSMTPEYEKPLEVVIGMTLQRTPLEATGPYRERLNAMIGGTYRIVSIFPGKVFFENIDATRAKAEKVLRLPTLRVTPSLFEKATPEQSAAVQKTGVRTSSRIMQLLSRLFG